MQHPYQPLPIIGAPAPDETDNRVLWGHIGDYRIAPIWYRIPAWAIDWLCLTGLAQFINREVIALNGSSMPISAVPVTGFYSLAAAALLICLAQMFAGATLGKWIMGLRAVVLAETPNGIVPQRMGIIAMLIRWLSLPSHFLFFGICRCYWHTDRQTWVDSWSRCYVIQIGHPLNLKDVGPRTKDPAHRTERPRIARPLDPPKHGW